MDITVNGLINPLKFLIPCMLLYVGCRTRERIIMASTSIMLLYFLISIQVIRYMGFHPSFSGQELSARAAKILQRSVGYNRVDLSMMLAGASWAAVAFSRLFEKKSYRWLALAAAAVILFAQSLTGGRAGYISWAGIALILCTLRWRHLLPLIPAAVMAIVIFMPSVRERMLSGFSERSGAIAVEEDTSEITSGRNMIWPYVIAKIKQSPLIGYGRFAMPRTGLSSFSAEEFGDEFNHPHNAYLEMLLDNGVLGFLCVVPIYFVVLKRGFATFIARPDVIFEITGGMAVALVLALLLGSFGAQTLYPREGVMGMWAAIGVLLRVSVERSGAFFNSSGETWDSDDEPSPEFAGSSN
jgi:O-antigen ligase